MRYILLIIIIFSTTTYAEQLTDYDIKVAANAANVNTDSSLLSSLNKIGEGQMKVLFWKVYKAEFYTSGSVYQEQTYPKALKLTYQRDIEQKEFIDATKDQWNKLNAHFNERIISETLEAQWVTQLKDIFPNITEKDVILFILTEQKQAHFYLKTFDNNKNQYNETYQVLGTIKDTNFGDYFLSIWLSEHTTEPKLRKQLIENKK
ncbi:chalcone isomerase family protein [Colwellia sp. RE-S-Sl-9]